MARRRLERLAHAVSRLLDPRLVPRYDFGYLDRLLPERLASVGARSLAELAYVTATRWLRQMLTAGNSFGE